MNVEELPPVIVGGFRIAIKVDNVRLVGDGLYGQHRNDELCILIRDDVPRALIAETVLHEVIHAISSVYLENLVLDEQRVGLLAQGLFQVIQSNPRLIEFIQQANVQQANEK